MSFVSPAFLAFLMVFLLGYFVLPKRVRWVWLLLGSYVFYGWASPKMALFLLFSSATTWGFPVLIGKAYSRRDIFISQHTEMAKDERNAARISAQSRAKLYLILAMVTNLGLLLFLKYANFFLGILGASQLDGLILPLGISFYTFQSLGYCIDVYREVVPPQGNFFKHALYVGFFPQIAMGPIGRYAELAPQLFERHGFDYARFVNGFTRMLWGFFKKIVVADTLALVIDPVYAAPHDHSGIALMVVTVLYAFQLYADFSGYMDIAIGISRVLGIKLDENFKTPYFSRSVPEFWRRWHITLGAWFRDYLYYPILRSGWCSSLGKRLTQTGHKKFAKTLTIAIGLAVTWIMIGLWHGAAWNFVLHGMYYGTFMILAVILEGLYAKIKSRLYIDDRSRLWRFFQIFRTFTIVCVGYVLFRSADLSTAMGIYWSIAKAVSMLSTAPLKIAILVVAFGWIMRRTGKAKRHRLPQILGLLTLVCVGFVFFTTPDVHSAAYAVKAAAKNFVAPFQTLFSEVYFLIKRHSVIIAGSLTLCLTADLIERSTGLAKWWSKRKTWFRWLVLYVLLLSVLLFAHFNSVDAGNFLYFRF